MQNSFIFDVNKCEGCNACQIACTIENNLPLDKSWRAIYSFNSIKFPDIISFNFSLACNHCLLAPCMSNCPAIAYSRDENTGAVILDSTKCLGCKYCSWQCPYNAPRFNEETGVMEKCTFCLTRQQNDLKPACVKGCPTGALGFGEYVENKNDHLGFPSLGLQPAINLIPFRKNKPPEMATEDYQYSKVEFQPKKHDVYSVATDEKNISGKLSLLKKVKGLISGLIGEELPLLIFTYITSILFGYSTSKLIINSPLNPYLIIILSFICLGLGIFHLGNKKNAYRIIFNIRGSWLSREIIFFSLFTGLLIINFYFENKIIYYLSISCGALTLLSIDMIYRTKSRIYPSNYLKFHSAESILNGIFLLSIFSLRLDLFIFTASVKLFLYVLRKFIYLKRGFTAYSTLSYLRVIIGLIIPFLLLLFKLSTEAFIIFALIGELIDRFEFYMNLKFINPEIKMEHDIRKLLSIQ